MTAATPLLEIRDLDVSFPSPAAASPDRGAWRSVVRGAALTVDRGEMVGLVGESGSGKSLTALSILRLVPPPGRVTGQVLLDGPHTGERCGDLLTLPERELRRVRGGRIGFVFQEPAAALDPVYTIGFQIAEAVRAHRDVSRREAREEAVRLLDRVGLPDARRRLGDYPHQLSGGQRQRVGIAVALAAGPDLLLADEPTTALDVTLQAQVLDLLAGLRRDLGLAVLLITHDLGIVAETCDRVAVMHQGEVVETADVETLFRAPSHSYTRFLLSSLTPGPSPSSPHPIPGRGETSKNKEGEGLEADQASDALLFSPLPGKGRGELGEGPGVRAEAAPPLVTAAALCRDFTVRRGLLQRTLGVVRAVDRVDLAIGRGECLALVGESGSGKTTLGRCLIRLQEPSSGRIVFAGEDLLALRPRALRALRRRFQMVFQDPGDSLDPRQRVGAILAEPLALHTALRGAARAGRIAELLALVGLLPEHAERLPHELSGGQRQRVGIARALAAGPDLLVADEPVSALDVSVRSQVLDLLAGLRAKLGLAVLFISHDLAAVEKIADRVAVMYLGRVVEEASREDLFRRPLHPYTVSLLSAVPIPDPRRRRARIVLAGEPPSPLAPPAGCAFHPRCPIRRPRCATERPPLTRPAGEVVEEDRLVACFFPGELAVSAELAAPVKGERTL
jgi:peptide/nickel transport system ATP-binding protein